MCLFFNHVRPWGSNSCGPSWRQACLPAVLSAQLQSCFLRAEQEQGSWWQGSEKHEENDNGKRLWIDSFTASWTTCKMLWLSHSSAVIKCQRALTRQSVGPAPWKRVLLQRRKLEEKGRCSASRVQVGSKSEDRASNRDSPHCPVAPAPSSSRHQC